MFKTASSPTPFARHRRIALAALAVFGIVVAAIGALRYGERRAAFAVEGAALHRLLSQRVDQHDAHMTSLSALAQAADPPPAEAIAQVAASIVRFYPRIVTVDIADLTADPPVTLLGSDIPLSRIAAASRANPAQTFLLPAEGARLLLVKRVPAPAATRYFDVLVIDLKGLIAADPPAAGAVQLLYDGRVLIGEAATSWAPLVYEAALASRTQPLVLRVTAPLDPATLLPWPLLAAAALLVGLGAVALERWMAAREAARRAQLAGHEARLAHAGRVNAMGEMASGIAHELTQPLTAILAQAQAGQRLLARPELDRAAIGSVFEATVRNARRAGDILARLRSWVAKREPGAATVDLAAVVADVARLLAADMQSAGIALDVENAAPGLPVTGDAVEMEQVLFNLLRNAIDAASQTPAPRRIAIRLSRTGDEGTVTVRDSGPGFSAEGLGRMFEPFHTTKPGGLGLGLALCTTLVERQGGRLTGRNHAGGGAEMRIALPAAPAMETAA